MFSRGKIELLQKSSQSIRFEPTSSAFAEAKRFDKANGDMLWWDAICKEMKNVRIAFEEFEGDVSAIPPGYQEIRYHMIFDIKMGENFRRKARMVADGHRTETPAVFRGFKGFCADRVNDRSAQ